MKSFLSKIDTFVSAFARILIIVIAFAALSLFLISMLYPRKVSHGDAWTRATMVMIGQSLKSLNTPYEKVGSCNEGIFAGEEIGRQIKMVEKEINRKMLCGSDKYAWALEIQLPYGQKYFCIDSSGVRKMLDKPSVAGFTSCLELQSSSKSTR